MSYLAETKEAAEPGFWVAVPGPEPLQAGGKNEGQEGKEDVWIPGHRLPPLAVGGMGLRLLWARRSMRPRSRGEGVGIERAPLGGWCEGQ